MRNPSSTYSRRIVSHLQEHSVVYLFAALFTAAMFTLQLLKHNAFNSRIGDFARFSQAIWSVLDGRLLYTTMPGRSILGDHFSPIMVTAAPFLLVWPNERVLFLVQALNVAATGVILSLIMRDRRPHLAAFFALAFFLNANVHTFTLIDFRRITFGLPWFALALLGLSRRNRPMLLIGLLVALLAKESFSLYIASIGLYLLIVERDWKWGIGLTLLGGTLLIVISDFVIPAFGGGLDYPQLFYYDHLGDSYGDIIRTFIERPRFVFEILFSPERRLALFKTLLPLGFLVLLAPQFALIYLPFLSLILLSHKDIMYQLDEHYTATLIPVFFAAIAMGWDRLSPRWDRWLMGWLAVATLVGYLLYSPAPFGGNYRPEQFDVTAHDRAGSAMARRVPEEVVLLAQTHYTPHLTHVDEIDVFLQHHDGLPFSAERIEKADYLFIDRTISQEPIGQYEIELIVKNLLADPNMKIVEENDGIFFLQKGISDHPAQPINITYEGQLRLDRVEFATTDDAGFFIPAENELVVTPGQTIRVSLFWEALADNLGERTISIRLAAADGFLLAQQDHQPAEGIRPTSWWQEGTQVRDIHYLAVPEGTASQIASIDIVVYDSFVGTIIQPDQNPADVLNLTPVRIEPK